MPVIVPVGAAGALGTLLKLAFGLAAVAPAVPDTNLAEKLYKFPTLRPLNVLPTCQAPVPTRYWVVQPANGGAISLTVMLVVVLLSNNGAAGAAGAAVTLIILAADHSPSLAMFQSPVPLCCLTLTSTSPPGVRFVMSVPVNGAHVDHAPVGVVLCLCSYSTLN